MGKYDCLLRYNILFYDFIVVYVSLSYLTSQEPETNM